MNHKEILTNKYPNNEKEINEFLEQYKKDLSLIKNEEDLISEFYSIFGLEEKVEEKTEILYEEPVYQGFYEEPIYNDMPIDNYYESPTTFNENMYQPINEGQIIPEPAETIIEKESYLMFRDETLYEDMIDFLKKPQEKSLFIPLFEQYGYKEEAEKIQTQIDKELEKSGNAINRDIRADLRAILNEIIDKNKIKINFKQKEEVFVLIENIKKEKPSEKMFLKDIQEISEKPRYKDFFLKNGLEKEAKELEKEIENAAAVGLNELDSFEVRKAFESGIKKIAEKKGVTLSNSFVNKCIFALKDTSAKNFDELSEKATMYEKAKSNLIKDIIDYGYTHKELSSSPLFPKMKILRDKIRNTKDSYDLRVLLAQFEELNFKFITELLKKRVEELKETKELVREMRRKFNSYVKEGKAKPESFKEFMKEIESENKKVNNLLSTEELATHYETFLNESNNGSVEINETKEDKIFDVKAKNTSTIVHNLENIDYNSIFEDSETIEKQDYNQNKIEYKNLISRKILGDSYSEENNTTGKIINLAQTFAFTLDEESKSFKNYSLTDRYAASNPYKDFTDRESILKNISFNGSILFNKKELAAANTENVSKLLKVATAEDIKFSEKLDKAQEYLESKGMIGKKASDLLKKGREIGNKIDDNLQKISISPLKKEENYVKDLKSKISKGQYSPKAISNLLKAAKANELSTLGKADSVVKNIGSSIVKNYSGFLIEDIKSTFNNDSSLNAGLDAIKNTYNTMTPKGMKEHILKEKEERRKIAEIRQKAIFEGLKERVKYAEIKELSDKGFLKLLDSKATLASNEFESFKEEYFISLVRATKNASSVGAKTKVFEAILTKFLNIQSEEQVKLVRDSLISKENEDWIINPESKISLKQQELFKKLEGLLNQNESTKGIKIPDIARAYFRHKALLKKNNEYKNKIRTKEKQELDLARAIALNKFSELSEEEQDNLVRKEKEYLFSLITEGKDKELEERLNNLFFPDNKLSFVFLEKLDSETAENLLSKIADKDKKTVAEDILSKKLIILLKEKGMLDNVVISNPEFFKPEVIDSIFTEIEDKINFAEKVKAELEEQAKDPYLIVSYLEELGVSKQFNEKLEEDYLELANEAIKRINKGEKMVFDSLLKDKEGVDLGDLKKYLINLGEVEAVKQLSSYSQRNKFEDLDMPEIEKIVEEIEADIYDGLFTEAAIKNRTEQLNPKDIQKLYLYSRKGSEENELMNDIKDYLEPQLLEQVSANEVVSVYREKIKKTLNTLISISSEKEVRENISMLFEEILVEENEEIRVLALECILRELISSKEAMIIPGVYQEVSIGVDSVLQTFKEPSKDSLNAIELYFKEFISKSKENGIFEQYEKKDLKDISIALDLVDKKPVVEKIESNDRQEFLLRLKEISLSLKENFSKENLLKQADLYLLANNYVDIVKLIQGFEKNKTDKSKMWIETFRDRVIELKSKGLLTKLGNKYVIADKESRDLLKSNIGKDIKIKEFEDKTNEEIKKEVSSKIKPNESKGVNTDLQILNKDKYLIENDSFDLIDFVNKVNDLFSKEKISEEESLALIKKTKARVSFLNSLGLMKENYKGNFSFVSKESRDFTLKNTTLNNNEFKEKLLKQLKIESKKEKVSKQEKKQEQKEIQKKENKNTKKNTRVQ